MAKLVGILTVLITVSVLCTASNISPSKRKFSILINDQTGEYSNRRANNSASALKRTKPNVWPKNERVDNTMQLPYANAHGVQQSATVVPPQSSRKLSFVNGNSPSVVPQRKNSVTVATKPNTAPCPPPIVIIGVPRHKSNGQLPYSSAKMPLIRPASRANGNGPHNLSIRDIPRLPSMPPELTAAMTSDNRIGRGTFASVYKVNCNGPKALKCSDRNLHETELMEHLREINLLRSIHDPNIIKIYGVYQDQRQLCYLLELAPYGNLLSLIDELHAAYADHPKFTVLLELLAPRVALEIAGGLRALNQKRSLHRDLKPDNVVVFGDRLALIDFGISRPIDRDGDGGEDDRFGTPHFFPPEYLGNHPIFDDRGDLWALGVTLYYLATMDFPNDTDDEDELSRLIQIAKTFHVNGMGGEFHRVLNKLLSPLSSRYQRTDEFLSDVWLEQPRRNKQRNEYFFHDLVHYVKKRQSIDELLAILSFT